MLLVPARRRGHRVQVDESVVETCPRPPPVAGEDLFYTSLLPQQRLKECDAATSLATKESPYLYLIQFRHLTTRQARKCPAPRIRIPPWAGGIKMLAAYLAGGYDVRVVIVSYQLFR